MSPSRLKTTMDILELNSKIQKFIDDESINNTENEKIIFQINTLLNGEFNLRPRMINKLNCLKESLKTSVEEYYNLKYFNVDVAPLIEKYHILNNQVVIIPFFNTNKKHLKEHAIKKEVIQKEFIQKLKDYTSLKNFEFMMKNYAFVPRSSPPPCLCGNKTEFIRDEDRAVCAICSTEQSLISNTSSFSDVGRVNMASKYTYNRKVHFRDCIIQYQGKQKTHIPEEIYTILEVKLMEKKIINNEYNDRFKRFEKVTRIMVLDILKELESKDIKKFYDDIVLIHHTLTGQPCDNIEYLEDSLLDDFDKLTETYDNLYTNDSVEEEGSKNKISKRKNFINAQFVLYQLLRKHGHPCNEMDFLTLKTSERKRFHHTICKELFNILGWKYSFSI
ncbi:DNA binding/packing protein [Invertebrate iridescent virus 30]|uniref:DNA binding/packing protein n=1 Tax=Invertebrate iridescent virus 30 TaxID=345585 RepID=W8W2Y2_9VIRU|nr:DNA binding/packing protein [Invertebrate iridescent virus 30]CCV02334.1 DNA binding/packing protein [Invertebrate iridescent virus 30]